MMSNPTGVILSTTPSIDGRPIRAYLGIVTGQAILGAAITKDLFAAMRDVVGGRASGYERELADARTLALEELADAARALGGEGVVGIDLDYETVGSSGSMLMVAAAGTAVRFHVDEARPEVEWQHDLQLAPAT